MTEDISARHMRLALHGWKRLVGELSVARPNRPRARAVVAEAEVWMRRLQLMHAGQIRQIRWHTIGR